jgi:hypothetical protein
MPRTARAMARRLKRRYMPYSADFNIAAGTEYLVVMLEQFDDDLHLALAANNNGPAANSTCREAGAPPPKPRQSYVAHVERAARAFCERLPLPRHEPDAGPFVCAAREQLPIARAVHSARATNSAHSHTSNAPIGASSTPSPGSPP